MGYIKAVIPPFLFAKINVIFNKTNALSVLQIILFYALRTRSAIGKKKC